MKKIYLLVFLLIALVLPGIAAESNGQYILNPFTGKMDYYVGHFDSKTDYYGVVKDTTTGKAAMTLSGSLSIAASSNTPSTYPIVFDGSTGNLKGTSLTITGSSFSLATSTLSCTAGVCTFGNTIAGSISGNAATVTNGLYTTGGTMTGKLGLAVKTKAELALITPAVGDVYFCSDTTPARIAVATGTSAGNFGDSMGLTLY